MELASLWCDNHHTIAVMNMSHMMHMEVELDLLLHMTHMEVELDLLSHMTNMEVELDLSHMTNMSHMTHMEVELDLYGCCKGQFSLKGLP